MKIVAAIKQTPERSGPMHIDAAGAWIDESALQYAIDESDAYALEQALQLKDKHGGEVVVVSAGPARVAAALREALARGADRALQIDGAEGMAGDPLRVARLLAAAIAPENADLVLTGVQSSDVGFGQTGILLAELLGLPHASLILEIERSEAGFRVKREWEEGWFQWIDLPAPALLAIQSGGAKLRYATLMGIKRARSKGFRALAGDELVVDRAPAVTLDRVALPQKPKHTQRIGGSPKEAAVALLKKLRGEAHVL